MKMPHLCMFVILVIFSTCGITFSTEVSLVNNVINAITLNFGEENIENSSNYDKFWKHFVEKVTKTKAFNTTGTLGACLSPVNISECKQYLRTNCVNVEDLMERSIHEHINFTEYFPAILYQLHSPACFIEDDVHLSKDRQKHSYANVWAYSIGYACLICFVVSNVGGLLAPFMKKDFFQRIMLFCVALAVGTLASVGLLVLIPESMHLTGENSPVQNYHFKMATVIGGIFFFYMTEKSLKMYFSKSKKSKNNNEMTETMVEATKEENMEQEHSHFPGLQVNGDEKDIQGKDGETNIVEVSNRRSKKLSTVTLMVLVGDGLHKFVDGISIGAAFSENTYLGFSISLAVICEELPHELACQMALYSRIVQLTNWFVYYFPIFMLIALRLSLFVCIAVLQRIRHAGLLYDHRGWMSSTRDIAILLHSGLSMKRALLYNFLAATTCFVGLAIGILVGENTNANSWIFAVAGGMFSYISLVDILPEMAVQARHIEERGIENKWTAMFIQCFGLLTGFIIIFMLAMFGGSIKL